MKTARATSTPSKRPTKKQKKTTSLINPPRRRFISPENKNIDTLVTGSFPPATTTATLTLLNGIDDGPLSNQRIGRKVIIDQFAWKFKVNMATTTVGASPIRNLIVYDKQPNANPPAILDVVFVNSITTAMNLNNSARFLVISDKVYNGIGTSGPQSMMDKGFQKLNLPEMFNDASTQTIASITTGSIYLIQWSDGGFGTAAPVDAFYSRLRFVDA